MKKASKPKRPYAQRRVTAAQTAEKVRKRIGYTAEEIRRRIRKYDSRSLLD